MPDIGHYTDTTELVLVEAGKYFALLIFSVLAIRLWRWWIKIPDKLKNVFLPVAVTLIAAAIGYFSMHNSLGKLYLHYGMAAFRNDNLASASSLFDTSFNYWKSADATGARGVCLLLAGRPDEGIQLIEQAKAVRNNKNNSFESFYEGLYYFQHGQRDKAVAPLQVAWADDTYRWSATKFFAIMLLDENRPSDAEDWMKPFMESKVTECDQAYIMASLALAKGDKTSARALLDKFPRDEEDRSLVGKARFDKLRSQLGD